MCAGLTPLIYGSSSTENDNELSRESSLLAVRWREGGGPGQFVSLILIIRPRHLGGSTVQK